LCGKSESAGGGSFSREALPPVFGVTSRKEANGSQRSEKVAYFKFKQAQRRNNGANGAILEATLEAEKLVDKSFRFHVST
jgi:hypothetical protein